MGIGPFDSLAFPDVYTQTLNEPPRATAAGDLRFPAFIGVANETITTSNYEMFRGSSAMADNKIVKENVSSQLTGANRNFTVTYKPVVDGSGTGTVTTDPSKVTVYVNGNAVAVASVDGTTGEIYLVNIPAMGDEVLCTYYYKLTDTLHSLEDITDQVDGVRTIFRTHNYPIVDGSNGGITTTDVTKIQVFVNAVRVVPTALDGDAGLFTLAPAPTIGQSLKVTYYDNELQNTADILPSPYIASVSKVGYAPGSSDFIQGVDFVVDTTGAFSTIQWGASFKIAAGQHTIGTTYFNDALITGTLFDNHNFRRQATGTVDGTNALFTLEAPAANGQGRGILTEDPSLLTAYIGTGASDATVVDILQVINNNQILLATAPDASKEVFVTQYSNLLPDDNWTVTNLAAGGTGVGTYSISGVNSGVGMDVQYSPSDTTVADTAFGSENVTYPNGTGPGNRDTQVIPGYAVAETVTLTFTDSPSNASKYIVTSSNPAGTGSSGDNTGFLNQTYIDKKTGFRVTVNQGALVTYVTGDKIGYTVSSVIPVDSVPTRAIPGLKVAIPTTAGVGAGDTGLINTYNMSGVEPNVGDFYYVSFTETKRFNSSGILTAKLYTQEKDVYADTGDLTINNKVGLAAHLALMNGSVALAIQQIKRAVGSADAPDSRYISAIDSFNEPMEGGIRPSLLEPVTTSPAVVSYLKNSNVIQSGIRYANERMSYFGFPINTSPSAAQIYAKTLNSERMTALYPDGAITTIPDANGNDVEYLVDGAFLAAAIAGRDVSPAYDVAEPLDRKSVVGFRRLYRRLDSVNAAMTANAGITLIEEQGASMVVKMALTTDLTSNLTRTPSVIRIKDFVQKGTRSILRPFIGQKFLAQKTGDIEQTLTSYMGALKTANIIQAFTGIKATPDANDPMIVNVVGYYAPVLPLLWIVVTYNLRSSM